jgi:hypothetical protein
VSGPNDLIFNPGQGPVDLGTIGNLCSQCHQGRSLSPFPTIGGDAVVITSSRYGYHHGPQAQIVAGVGAFDFGNAGEAGLQPVASGPSAHGDPAANPEVCGRCHMGQAFGEQAGGHTWKMSYEYHGHIEDNVSVCIDCHKSIEDFDYVGIQSWVETLLDDLATELMRIGVMRSDHYATTGTWPADVAAAFVNWQMIEEDRSKGVHNPPYVVGILQSAIAKMQTY